MNYRVYTDGSCVTTTKFGGYGVIIIDEDESIIYSQTKSFSNTTNNRMELMAFLDAFAYVNNEISDADSVVFYTDSAYISNCFAQKWYRTWRANGWKASNRVAVKNIDLWKPILKEYDKCKQCKIEKVKSHSGIKWNEAVDKLANQWRGTDEKDFIIDQE